MQPEALGYKARGTCSETRSPRTANPGLLCRSLRPGIEQNVTVALPLARGPFLQATVCLDLVGAYPSVNCDDFRFRVDTGATWSWEDAIARPKHAALQALCRERLAAEAKAERARLAKEHLEPWDRALEIHCEPADLRDLTPRPDGSLSFTVFRGPHASGNQEFGFQLSAKELKAWADPQGPFGPWLRCQRP